MEFKLVWVPHQEDGFQLGHIIDLGADTFTVQPLAKSAKPVQAVIDRVFPAEEKANDVEDNCSLLYLNEATLLNNLKMRFKKKHIYTYVANILLSVNPYELYKQLYSTDTMREYQGLSLGLKPPHVFAIADKAYREMKAYKSSQAVIVSGESGAGKTEATKYILRYLTELYGASSSHIEERIVEANPLLESFGNAKTMRNNNSSRFGKFVEIHFNDKCHIVGGHISHYLLEKSRVVSQWNEERNYHVFYRLLVGAPTALKKSLCLDKVPKSFTYLNPVSLKSAGIDDSADFKNLVQSMKNIGLTEREQEDIFRLVAAVLWMGNITFEEDTIGKQTGSKVDKKGQEALAVTSKLLQLSPDDLQTSLTSRVMTTTRGGAMGTIYQVPLKKEQATYARDALAKTLYSRLFDRLVKRVNTCFPFETSSYYIGVLDIAGFEYFQVNSFEQFCINYCNEKLQQFFNRRILKDEQELYHREMLSVTDVEFTDNQDCIDLIEAAPTGIINLLDEQCKLPQASDVNFTERVHMEHAKHFRLLVPRKSKLIAHRNLRDEEGFIVRHFAGAVCYSTKGFLDKNNDALHDSLEQLMLESKDPMVQDLVVENIDPKKITGKLMFISIGGNFRKQLGMLMEKLYSTGSSFIRCIKPNSYMRPGEFQGGSILSQLQCAGMVSVLELMQGGYPSRANFNDLYSMYKALLPVKLQRLQPRLFCEALFRALGMLPTDYAFGMSKVFFKPGKFALFDQIMHSDPENLKQLIAKVEHWLIRKRWKKLIFGAISVLKLAKKIKCRNENAVLIQKCVRTFIAVRKHRPRYLGIRNITMLRTQIDQMSGMVNNLKEDKGKLSADITDIQKAIEISIREIKDNPNVGRAHIEMKYKELQATAEVKLQDLLQREVEQKEKEESERLRRIKEDMERERQKREDEEARRVAENEERERQRREEEEERRMRQELEDLRRREEEERRKVEESMQAELTKLSLLEAEEEAVKRQQEEQERMDFELAFRIAEVEASGATGGDIIETQSVAMESRLARKTLKRGANIKTRQQETSAKKFDMSKMKYAELRDMINTSCEIELLNAGREEFHRRLRVYNAWKMKNKRSHRPGGGTSSDEPQRAPEDIMQIAESVAKSGVPPPIPQRTVSIIEDQKQRYFKIPFIRPSDQGKRGYRKKGWWLAHFDGQWIARQMELHPEKPPVLLVAGMDDLEMCELSLDETRLGQKPGAEVLEKDFENIWVKHGGKTYIRPTQRAKASTKK